MDRSPEASSAVALVTRSGDSGSRRPTAGCAAGATTGGATSQRVDASGVSRTYRRYLPDGAGTAPLPVVINLHGLTSNIDQQVAVSAFEALAATEHFIVLTPQALGTPTGWSLDEGANNSDVAFISAMLDRVEADVCVDESRVYATGISDGGIMSTVLACRMRDRIAAVGLVSGITRIGNCDDAPAMPMIVFWGKKDVVLPYCGGLGPIVSSLIAGKPLADAGPPMCPPANFNGFPPVEDALAKWVSADGCGATPEVAPAGSDVELRVFGGCRDGASVEFYVVADGGHTWPGSKLMEALSASPAASIIGFTTDEIDATKLIWSFFQRYTR